MRPLVSALPLVALVMLTAGVVGAQTTYPAPLPYAVQPLTDADLLAEQVRALAANPTDLNALTRAGELALKLDDSTGAAAFFARAERIDPRNARVTAGEGSLLVAAERPGEALRRFAAAESLGGDVHGFAADRGLAYDLIGEQERAQRDYRLALRIGSNDETQRRYALSLGISGKRDLALQQIDALLRRSDRGAWRARAFILAMGGDRGGAERIASSMMPVGLSQGLQPFFAILPTLSPADRAFAVHFGEVRATPERIADARLTPPLAVLGPDPTAPVEVAALAAKAAPVREERRNRRTRDRDRIATNTVAPLAPLLQPPAYLPGGAMPAPTPVLSRPTPISPQVAMTGPAMLRAPVPVSAPVPAPVAQRAIVSAEIASAAMARPRAPGPTLRNLPPVVPTVVTPAPTPTPAATAPVVILRPAPAPPVSLADTARPASTPVPVRSEESILASILADIVVPASELGVEPLRAAPVPARPATIAADTAAFDKAAAEQKVAERKLADRKVADKKLTGKKAAEARAAVDAKKAEEAKKHDPKLLEPSRIWVQVAGGASQSNLAKEWARVKGKSPAAFRGKAGWTTPLRATNRVLAGPFKSEDEAQGFVNTIAGDGITAFVFTSTAGQKIDKLPVK